MDVVRLEVLKSYGPKLFSLVFPNLSREFGISISYFGTGVSMIKPGSLSISSKVYDPEKVPEGVRKVLYRNLSDYVLRNLYDRIKLIFVELTIYTIDAGTGDVLSVSVLDDTTTVSIATAQAGKVEQAIEIAGARARGADGVFFADVVQAKVRVLPLPNEIKDCVLIKLEKKYKEAKRFLEVLNRISDTAVTSDITVWTMISQEQMNNLMRPYVVVVGFARGCSRAP